MPNEHDQSHKPTAAAPFQPISTLITEILALWEQRTQAKPHEFSLPEPQKPLPRKRPLRNAWQTKWLDLEATHPDIQALADKAEQFATNWFNARSNGSIVTTVGHPGCGKTHVARALWEWSRLTAFMRWERTSHRAQTMIPSVTFQRWARVASAEQTTEEGFSLWMREVDESSMVIIDDIGTETDRYRTGIPCSRLCQLLDHCRNKWLWITTNKHPNEWATTWDKRVEDRMLAGDVLVLDAPSWRSDRP